MFLAQCSKVSGCRDHRLRYTNLSQKLFLSLRCRLPQSLGRLRLFIIDLGPFNRSEPWRRARLHTCSCELLLELRAHFVPQTVQSTLHRALRTLISHAASGFLKAGFQMRAWGPGSARGFGVMPGHLFPQDLQNSNLPSPMRSVKTHDPHLHTVYAREGIAAGLSARPFGFSAAPQELKKACTPALQETPRQLAPLLCKTVCQHSARKTCSAVLLQEENGRFCKAQNPRKLLHKKNKDWFQQASQVSSKCYGSTLLHVDRSRDCRYPREAGRPATLSR